MNKILITGVAGFLGSNLAKELIKDEDNIVFGIDDLSCSSMSNLYPLLRNDRFNFFQLNLVDKIPFNVDYLYHLAGNGDNSKYFENKFENTLLNIEVTKNILEYTKATGCKSIFTVGFVDYQQHNLEYFMKYDLMRMNQDLILEYANKNNLDCKIAKLTNPYGQNMKNSDNRFIPKVINKAYHNENIVIENDKSSFYTYSKDVVLALKTIMNSYCDSNVIDVSSSNLHLKSDIAKLIITFTKSKSKVIINNQEVYHPNYKPNLTILNNELNFRCTTPILEGISKTIDYFRLMYFC